MPDYSADEFRKASLLRAHLESFAARHAAMRVDDFPSNVRVLNRALPDMAEAINLRDYQAFRKSDLQLHQR